MNDYPVSDKIAVGIVHDNIVNISLPISYHGHYSGLLRNKTDIATLVTVKTQMPVKPSMKFTTIRLGKNFQIFQAIIVLNAVFMMHMIVWVDALI